MNQTSEKSSRKYKSSHCRQCTRPPPAHEVAMRIMDLYLKMSTHLNTYIYASEQSRALTVSFLYLHRSGNTSVFKVYASWALNICYCGLGEALSLKFLRVLNPAFISSHTVSRLQLARYSFLKCVSAPPTSPQPVKIPG